MGELFFCSIVCNIYFLVSVSIVWDHTLNANNLLVYWRSESLSYFDISRLLKKSGRSVTYVTLFDTIQEMRTNGSWKLKVKSLNFIWSCPAHYSSLQRHLARTAGRWKDGPKRNTLSELQDELMSVRLREAEAQAELRETRQRMLELETQVRVLHSFPDLFFVFCFQIPVCLNN